MGSLTIKDWLRHLLRIFLPVYKFESDKMIIVYAGYSPIKRSYYSRMLLSDNCNYKFLGIYWYSRIPGLLTGRNIDFAISEISRATTDKFRNSGGYIVPVWAAMRINIDRPLEQIFNKNRKVTNFKDVIRRVRKHNLTYEILHDKESLKFFKKRFYLPFITKRHRDEAFIEDLDEIWKSHKHPFLLAIKEEGNIIGMSFCMISRGVLHLLRVGLLDGNQEYMKHGVIGSTYYFGILEGIKRGCTQLDLGGGRTFLTDRLTKYKTGLGAEFVINLSPLKEYMWFGPNSSSAAVKEFLYYNPFMYVNNDFVLEKYKGQL